MWIFLEEFGYKMSRLVLFLNKAEYLVDFIRDNVSVLIDLILQSIFSIPLKLWKVLLVSLP